MAGIAASHALLPKPKDCKDGSDRGSHHSHGSGGPADRMSKRW